MSKRLRSNRRAIAHVSFVFLFLTTALTSLPALGDQPRGVPFDDCNSNGIPDACDLTCAGGCNVPGCGMSFDCNANGILDECDIASNFSEDCNANGIPDECELPGRALRFDGVNDFARVPSPSALPLGNAPRTVELWLRRNSADTEMGIFVYGSFSACNQFGLVLTPNCPNKLGFFGFLAGTCDLCSTNNVPVGPWTHVAVTYDGTVLRLYMNGALEASANRALNTILNASGLLIGTRNDINETWNGDIDEFRVWNYARSQTEIQADMYQRLTGNETGLVGYWNFQETGGQVIFDRSPSRMHGTLGATGSAASDDPTRITAAAPLTGDCNANGIPDECELEGNDCNANGIPDECDIAGTGSPAETAKIVAADAAASDFFGRSVAVSGDTAVVGAYLDDHAGGNDAGSAYVFTRSGGVWTQQQKLTASDAAAVDQFGVSVAVSGDTAVVGAYGDDHAGGTDAGSAYVFVRSGGVWTQQAKLTASDAAAFDLFGVSVAVSGDTAVIGAHLDDDAGSNSGSAHVFTRAAGVWTQQQKLTASDAAAGDQFGFSVAVSGDSVLLGAFVDDHAGGTDAGSAYVFVRSGGVWTQQAKLTAFDAAANDWFGHSVALAGDTAVVGARSDDHAGGTDAGSAYVFVRSGGVWTQQAKLTASDAAAGDQLGFSVAISGNTAVVGANTDDHASGTNAGSAYIFVRSGGIWTQLHKLTASDAAAEDEFGWSVAVSGETAIVGTYLDDHAGGSDAGSAYVFTLRSRDCNANGIPDECDIADCPMGDPSCADCNGNGVPDGCDIASGFSGDCNSNGIPDDCDVDPADPDGDGLVSADCNGNGIPDECILPEGLIDGIHPAAEHRVFVSSTTHNGNLGGLAGADAICQGLADAAGLQLRYKAIMSDSTTNARDRITLNGGPIYIFDSSNNRIVVKANGDLWDGQNLGGTIELDELGNQHVALPWTGTSPSGYAELEHCESWTSTIFFLNGRTGNTSLTDFRWVSQAGRACNTPRSLYCISQTPTFRELDCNDNGIPDDCEPLPAGVRVVRDVAAPGGDGTNWARPFRTLQDARAAAAGSGGAITQIWVAAGTYRPDETAANPQGTGSRSATFQLLNGVAIYGGFACGDDELSDRDPVNNVTILSGDLAENDGPNFANYGENSYHVVTASGTNATAVLDGFTITGGNANGPTEDSNGGAIYNNGGSLTLRNCTVVDSQANAGGGMYNASASPVVTDCRFSNNTAGLFGAGGGGMWNVTSNPTVTNCTFDGNIVIDTTGGSGAFNSGAAIYNLSSSPFINTCIFSGNLAEVNGGAIYTTGGFLSLSECDFDGNTAQTGGSLYFTNSQVDASDCTFTGNTASGGGGGAVRLGEAQAVGEFTACDFLDNSSTILGGAIVAAWGADLTVSGSRFESNHSPLGGAIGAISQDGQAITSATLLDSTFESNTSTTNGGALHLNRTTTSVEDTTFIGNSSTGVGGAVHTSNGGTTTLDRCRFFGNAAGDHTAAVFSAGTSTSMTDCVFVNHAQTPIRLDSVSSMNITDCVFAGNTGSQAIFSFGSSTAVIKRSIFAGQNIVGNGGTVTADNNSILTLSNCLLVGNAATGHGPTLRQRSGTFHILNSTIAANSAGGDGGGLWHDAFGGTSHIRNSILWGNTANNGALTNQAAQIFVTAGAATLNYSTIQDGDANDGIASLPGGTSGGNNRDRDPLFISGPSGTWTADASYNPATGQTTLTNANANGGLGYISDELVGMFLNPSTAQTRQTLIVSNTATTLVVWGNFTSLIPAGGPYPSYQVNEYRLPEWSPCVDRGDPAFTPGPGETDLSGADRVSGCRVDMGAYEAATGGAQTGDMDASGATDLADVPLFVNALLFAGTSCAADINGDTFVNSQDVQGFVDLLLGL